MNINEIINKFNFINEYNPKKGGLLKEWGEPNVNGWLNIGEIEGYSPWANAGNKLYIMVNPNAPESDDYSTFKYRNVYGNSKPDGSGNTLSISTIPTYHLNNMEIYPEFRNTYYGNLFLGKPKGKEGELQHNNFMKHLNVVGDDVILQHDSSYKITDGVVKRGKTNGYSNNSDMGVFFWGSKNKGNDPSNGQQYTYYCKVPVDTVYDLETNLDRIISSRKALVQYPYVATIFPNSDAIVVNTLRETPIWCVRDNQTGKYYDTNWNEIENIKL